MKTFKELLNEPVTGLDISVLMSWPVFSLLVWIEIGPMVPRILLTVHIGVLSVGLAVVGHLTYQALAGWRNTLDAWKKGDEKIRDLVESL